MKKYFLVVALLLLSSAHAHAKWQRLPHIFYVNFPVVSNGEQLTVSAQYRLPRGLEEPAPAVILLHTSVGIDSTGSLYVKALNNAGYATLEVDMWGARGLMGESDRPDTVHETIPDAHAALAFLAAKDEIDENRIALMGYSWGGGVTMLTATEQFAPSNSPYSFAAHIANYPVCWVYNVIPGFEFNKLTGPVLIQAAELDDYDLPDTCENLISSLPEADQQKISLNYYRGAYHTWDRIEPTMIIEDVFANVGQGGSATLSPNIFKAYKSTKKVIKFLNEHL